MHNAAESRGLKEQEKLKTGILVIDDDDSVRKSITRMLAAQGFEAVGASDADEGLELALKHAPAVIIVDLHLPLVPGNEVARKLREHPDFENTALIALSATVEDADPGLFDCLLQKPCTSETLVASISEAIKVKMRRRSAKSVLE
jgi:DNA-binding response OmpR family regulator